MSSNPPFLIPTLWNMGILLHKKAKLRKYMQHSVCTHSKSCVHKVCCLFTCVWPCDITVRTALLFYLFVVLTAEYTQTFFVALVLFESQTLRNFTHLSLICSTVLKDRLIRRGT